jgi:hypothetical protein
MTQPHLEEQENRKKLKVPKKLVQTKLTNQTPNQNKTQKSVSPKKPADKKAEQSAKRKLRV